jgi:hypothetical protein
VVRSKLFNVAIKRYPVYDMVAGRRMVCHRILHKAEHRYTLFEVCKLVKNFGKTYSEIKLKKISKFSNYI